jgi:hypothetical protein
MRPRTPRLLATAALLVSTACSSPTGAGEPTEARLRWAARGPASYTVRVARSCECLSPEMTGPVVVVVRDGVVASRSYAGSGAPVGASLAEHFPSVEEAFARIDAARRQNVARLVVRYDPTLGFPTEIAIDVDATMADDEVTYTLSDLRR